jgi:hypothetical protein
MLCGGVSLDKGNYREQNRTEGILLLTLVQYTAFQHLRTKVRPHSGYHLCSGRGIESLRTKVTLRFPQILAPSAIPSPTASHPIHKTVSGVVRRRGRIRENRVVLRHA